MNVLAVDTGYSATKIYSELKGARKTLIFPSVIGPAEFGEDFLGTKEDNFIAELSLYPGKVRNFGETAIRLNRGGEMTADRDMFTKHYNPALTLAGIARFIERCAAFRLPKRAELRIITLNPRLLNGISRCHTYIAHSYNLDSGLPISVSRLII